LGLSSGSNRLKNVVYDNFGNIKPGRFPRPTSNTSSAHLKLEKRWKEGNNTELLISLNFTITSIQNEEKPLMSCLDMIKSKTFKLESLQYSNEDIFYLDL
jgi:hypothetical protein